MDTAWRSSSKSNDDPKKGLDLTLRGVFTKSDALWSVTSQREGGCVEQQQKTRPVPGVQSLSWAAGEEQSSPWSGERNSFVSGMYVLLEDRVEKGRQNFPSISSIP